MGNYGDILKKSSEYVHQLFKENLPSWAEYHSYHHTMDIVEAVQYIGKGEKLAETELEIVSLAAWFHDTGYIDTADGHEERSVEIATRFLRKHGYPRERIQGIAGCIRATRIPQKPGTILEQVICDADMVHLGRRNFFEKNNLMRKELELRFQKPFSDREWLTGTIDFVGRHHYHTKFAQRKLGKQKTENLMKLKEQISKYDTSSGYPSKEAAQKEHRRSNH